MRFRSNVKRNLVTVAFIFFMIIFVTMFITLIVLMLKVSYLKNENLRIASESQQSDGKQSASTTGKTTGRKVLKTSISDVEKEFLKEILKIDAEIELFCNESSMYFLSRSDELFSRASKRYEKVKLLVDGLKKKNSSRVFSSGTASRIINLEKLLDENDEVLRNSRKLVRMLDESNKEFEMNLRNYAESSTNLLKSLRKDLKNQINSKCLPTEISSIDRKIEKCEQLLFQGQTLKIIYLKYRNTGNSQIIRGAMDIFPEINRNIVVMVIDYSASKQTLRSIESHSIAMKKSLEKYKKHAEDFRRMANKADKICENLSMASASMAEKAVLKRR